MSDLKRVIGVQVAGQAAEPLAKVAGVQATAPAGLGRVRAVDVLLARGLRGLPGQNGDAATLERLTAADAKLAEMEAALADTAQSRARLAPFSGEVNPGTYLNGVQVAWGWMDSAARFWLWFDASGRLYAPGGIDGSTLTGVQAAGVQATAEGGLYVGGYEAVPVIGDSSGRVAQGLLRDGRMLFPAGVIAPNIPQNITFAGERNRIDGAQSVSGPDLVGVGDSLTHGVGQTPYTSALAGLTGRAVANYGLGGQTSTEIAARFGASTTYLSVEGGTIPASGPVSVTVYDVDLLRTGAGASMTVTLYGVKGTLTRGAGTGVWAGAYTFTRTTPGNAVPVPARVQIIPDTGSLKERVMIIWVGNNNFTEASVIERDVLAIIRTLEAMKVRYLVLTLLNGNYLGRRANDTPNTDYQTILTINRTLMRLSNHVVDIQKLLPKDPLTDVVDAAYRIDDIHLNTAGYALIAGHIQDALTARGW